MVTEPVGAVPAQATTDLGGVEAGLGGDAERAEDLRRGSRLGSPPGGVGILLEGRVVHLAWRLPAALPILSGRPPAPRPHESCS